MRTLSMVRKTQSRSHYWPYNRQRRQYLRSMFNTYGPEITCKLWSSRNQSGQRQAETRTVEPAKRCSGIL